ncbi:hypothetical protein P7K49_012295 [Saguinus oedipus]|uniref:Uncharacterized protein n=1 Tax=Saguinus oedipus TaxID=9490 RepID=A0ABQ9VT43_SAGOE|nr:hypothetical protein P7K49_012295 [Saguinus oedipus]
MRTGDCCHLPGSLRDWSGSPAFSKVMEAMVLGPPYYVAQVTCRDGRFLSTIIRALDTPSHGAFCPIYHEGANGQYFLSLSSSNPTHYELCHTKFAVEKQWRNGLDFSEWQKDPGLRDAVLRCGVLPVEQPPAAISG